MTVRNDDDFRAEDLQRQVELLKVRLGESIT